MKVTFSKAALERAKAPAEGRVYLRDARAPGLVLQITAGGVKSFQLYRKVDGRPVRVTLGRFDAGVPDAVRVPEGVDATEFIVTLPALNVPMARRLAELLRASHGQRPAELKRERAGLPTVGTVLDDYRRLHLEPHRRPKTLSDWFLPGRSHLAQFEKVRVDQLTQAAVARWHSELGAEHATAANRALEVLRSSIEWARKKNELKLAANPAAGVEAFKETSRERFVTKPEVGKFFAALRATPQPWQDLLLLSLLTGQRRGAVQAMRWGHLELDAGVWHLPPVSSKSGKPVTVPLVKPVLQILERRRGLVPREIPFVFPAGAKSKTGHAGSPKKEWAKLLERSGLQDLRVHDLRRTVGSWMASANTSLHVIGAALGHSSRASTEVYARLQVDPVRAALAGAANEILTAAKPKKRQRA